MKCQVSIDWLTFSVKEKDPVHVIKKYLGLDPVLFQDPGYGFLGYTKMLRFSNICVCYAPREDDFFQNMGVCVSMSGNGCRAFESMSKLTFDGAVDQQGMGSVAFSVLFQLLVADESANVSRIDIACDDREGYLDMDEIVRKHFAGEINSRMRKRAFYDERDNKKCTGNTLYIGAPTSDFRIRIYDKAQEQGVDGHWIRVELVMRSVNANAFVEQMTNSESVGKLAAQVLNDKFSFIIRDDSNISRCTVCQWWTDFVSEVESVRLVTRRVVQHCVERIDSWVTDQVGPSLAIILRTLGWPHLFELARDAGERLSLKQQSLISDYNALNVSADDKM